MILGTNIAICQETKSVLKSKQKSKQKTKWQKVKLFGFTLAEVLIVLGIIGVLAEMTLPTLINNVKDSVNKTAYKKAFSDISNAFLSAQKDYTIDGCNNSVTGRFICYSALKSYFKVMKDCDGTVVTTHDNCWSTASGSEYFAISQPLDTYPSFIDSAGRTWALGGGDMGLYTC